MKKIFTTILVLCIAHINYAQTPCVPGTLTLPQAGYIIPDSATNFAHACINQYYEQIIYIKAPKDTQIIVLGNPTSATIDSFVAKKDITGLPPGLSVTAVPDFKPAAPPNVKTNFERLVIKGDSLACMKISGTIPTGTTPGPYNLSMEVRAYLTALGGLVKIDTLSTVNYYLINVLPDPCWPSSVTNVQENISQMLIKPNPARDIAMISVDAIKQSVVRYQISNTVGQVVEKGNWYINAGNNIIPINIQAFNGGIYFVNIFDGNRSKSIKLIKE